MDTEKSDRIANEIVAVINANIPTCSAAELLCGQLGAVLAMGRTAPQPMPPKYKAVLDAAEACLMEMLKALEVYRQQEPRKN